MFNSLNEIAILVSAILAVAMEHVWYSPLLFGNAWRKGAGLPQEEDTQSTWVMLRDSFLRVAMFCVLYASSIFLIHAHTPTVSYPVAVATIFVLTGSLTVAHALREHRSLAYCAIHLGYLALAVCGGVGVIVYWPW